MNATVKTPVLAAALVSALIATAWCARAAKPAPLGFVAATTASCVVSAKHPICQLPTLVITRPGSLKPAAESIQALVIHRLPDVIVSGQRERPITLASAIGTVAP